MPRRWQYLVVRTAIPPGGTSGFQHEKETTAKEADHWVPGIKAGWAGTRPFFIFEMKDGVHWLIFKLKFSTAVPSPDFNGHPRLTDESIDNTTHTHTHTHTHQPEQPSETLTVKLHTVDKEMVTHETIHSKCSLKKKKKKINRPFSQQPVLHQILFCGEKDLMFIYTNYFLIPVFLILSFGK